MALRSMEAVGYRGLQKLGRLSFGIPNGEPGSGLTIVTGPNNSGKSSLIECMRARSGHQTPSFSVGVRNIALDEVTIKYVFDEGEEEIKSVRKGSSESTRSQAANDRQVLVLPSRCSFASYFSRSVWLRDAYIRSSGLPAQREPALNNFERRLFNIIGDDASLTAFNTLVAKVLGFEPEWSIDQSEQGQHFLKFNNLGHSHSSDGMGEGIVSIFAIVDALYDARDQDVVVVDEPELSLHPALQKRLLQVLLDHSKTRQIVISTHSPYFIDLAALRNGASLARVVSGADGTEVYQLGQVSN